MAANTGSHIPEIRGRFPADALPGHGDLVVELVDLLQRQALGLVDHEVHKGNAPEAARKPDEEDLALEIRVAGAEVHQVWRAVCDGPVEQPVGRRGHGQCLGANLQREDLARHYPRDWAPGRREEENIDAHECDRGLLRCNVLCKGAAVGVLAGGGGAEDGDEELGRCHSDG